MRWRRNWSARPPRPKVRRLPADEQQQLLAKMTKEIARSPVLSAFGVRVRFLRGRFYVERLTPSGVEAWGRITPLKDDLLLEVERRSWSEVARGAAQKLIKLIAGDTKGTFHGLGSLDHALRKAGQGLTRLPMKVKDNKFLYSDTGEGCTVQEALFHYFGLPVEVIAEPALWYSYHRTPRSWNAQGSDTSAGPVHRHEPVGIIRRHLPVCRSETAHGEPTRSGPARAGHRHGGSLAGETQVEGVVLNGSHQQETGVPVPQGQEAAWRPAPTGGGGLRPGSQGREERGGVGPFRPRPAPRRLRCGAELHVVLCRGRVAVPGVRPVLPRSSAPPRTSTCRAVRP